jgi:hypothetical protein
MNTLLGILKWLRAGFKDGQSLFWAGIVFFAAYELMLSVGGYEPKEVSSLSILTLGFLAFGECTIQCASWLLAKGELPDDTDLVKWIMWGRPIIAVNLVMFWLLIVQFDGKAPLDAILITLALGFFGLSKTLYGTKFDGGLGSALLGVVVALPFLLIAGIEKLFF